MPETSEPTLLHPDNYADGCPHARLAELREAGATSWQPGTVDPNLLTHEVMGAWFVHRYEEVKAVLRDPATLRAAGDAGGVHPRGLSCEAVAMRDGIAAGSAVTAAGRG